MTAQCIRLGIAPIRGHTLEQVRGPRWNPLRAWKLETWLSAAPDTIAVHLISFCTFCNSGSKQPRFKISYVYVKFLDHVSKNPIILILVIIFAKSSLLRDKVKFMLCVRLPNGLSIIVSIAYM